MFLNTATGSGEIFPSKVDSAHLVVTRALSYSSLAKVIAAVLENGARPPTTGGINLNQVARAAFLCRIQRQ